MKTLTLFPEYAIENPSSLGPKKLKESKRKKLDELHAATEVKTEKRYVLTMLYSQLEKHTTVYTRQKGLLGMLKECIQS